MNKNEIIKDIQNIINANCWTISEQFANNVATALYNAGYGKFEENLVAEIQKAYNDGFNKGCETCVLKWDNGYAAGYNNAQVEVAKEILVKLMASTTPTFDKDGKPIMQITADFALNLCKKYNIKYEVDENE